MNTTAHAVTTVAPTPAVTAAADQIAATLRDRRTGHHGEPCDAFALCDSCRVGGQAVRLARIPQQRWAS